MKKRKKPTLLLTALILMLGVVAVLNTPASSKGGADNHSHNEQEEPPKTGNDVKVPDKAQLAATVSAGMKTPGKPTPGPMKGKMPPGEGSGPSILKPRTSINKPMPNDSSTSTQWYTDETPKNLPKTP